MESLNFNQYDETGFVILRNFYTPEDISRIEKNIVNLYALQALRFPAFRKLTNKHNPLEHTGADDLGLILDFFETNNKRAGFYAHRYITNSLVGKRFICNEDMFAAIGKLLNCPKELLYIDDDAPCLLASVPQKGDIINKRMIYDWHSECHYYPMRRNMLNVWLPIFADKKADNGTMYIMPGSHKKQHSCAFWRHDNNSFRQAQIPIQELSEFKQMPVEANVGDLVLFDSNLVHRGSENKSDKYTFTLIARVFDYSKDLVIDNDPGAGFMGATSDSFQDIQTISYNL